MKSKILRNLIIAILILAGLYFVISRFTEMEQIVEVLRRATPLWLGLAVLVEGLWFLDSGMAWQANYRLMGVEEQLKHLVWLHPAANFFLAVIAPSGGASAMAAYIADAKRRNQPTPRVLIAFITYFLFDYLAVLSAVMLGIIVLVRRHKLTWGEITAASILAIIAIVIIILLYIGMRWPKMLGRILAWFVRAGNWISGLFKKKPRIHVRQAYAFADEASQAVAVMRTQPGKWIKPFVLAVINKGLMITILYFLFLAFKVPATAGSVVAGFAIGYLFNIVSPTPLGLGIVEGIMTVTLRSLGVNIEEAAILTLAFRGVTFWVPFFAGMISFRFVTKSRPKDLVMDDPGQQLETGVRNPDELD